MDKITVFLEVWRAKWGYVWVERPFTTIKAFKEEYDYTFVFMGTSAVVYIGTEDYELTRTEALKIATDHIKGNIKIISIDLALCGGLPKRLQRNTTP